MKLFRTNNIVTVNCCREMFGIDLPSVTLSRRKEKFIQRLNHCNNTSVKRFISMSLRLSCCVSFVFSYVFVLPVNK